MNAPDLNEAVGIVIDTVLPALLSLVNGQSGAAGSQVNYLCGQLAASAAQQLSTIPSQTSTFWPSLAACFDAVQSVGTVTYAQIDSVRSTLEALPAPRGLPAVAVINFSIRMCLVELAKTLAATDFVSRQDVDNYFSQVNAAFSTAEETAANNMDNVAYIALINLHAAVSNDLSTRSRPLPSMVSYTYPRSRAALWIAQNLYQDGSRSDEIVAENKPIHPLFMPITVEALSS